MKGEESTAHNSQSNREPALNQVFTGRLFRRQNIHGHTFADKPKPSLQQPVRRLARIAILLAHAHRIQRSIDEGDYQDLADAAKQLDYSCARISQIMKLLVLAPDIREQILFFERLDGVEPTSERSIQ